MARPKPEIDAALERGLAAVSRDHGLPMRDSPQLRTLVEAALQGTVEEADVKREHAEDIAALREEHKEHAAQRYEAGKQRMRAKYADLADATRALMAAREFVRKSLAWTGPPSARDDMVAELTKAIRYFDPTAPDSPEGTKE
jgi:hypothetical protein